MPEASPVPSKALAPIGAKSPDDVVALRARVKSLERELLMASAASKGWRHRLICSAWQDVRAALRLLEQVRPSA